MIAQPIRTCSEGVLSCRTVQNVILRHGVSHHAEFLLDNPTTSTYDTRMQDRFSPHFKLEEDDQEKEPSHHAKIMRNGKYDIYILQSKRWNRTAVQ